MQYILSFRGPAKAGKTTAAKIISKHFPDFVNVSFADELKIEASTYMYDLLEELPSADKAIAVQFMNDTGHTMLDMFPSTPPKTEKREDVLVWTAKHKDLMRPFFQWYGQHKRKTAGLTYWIDKIRSNSCVELFKNNNLTFDDCRFPNEKEFLLTGDVYNYTKMTPIKVYDIYVYNPELDLTLPVYKDESEAMNLTAQNAGAVLTNRPSYGIKEYEKRVLEMFSILKELT